MATDSQSILGARATYHHGDLRAALVEAGLALAREGGPEAVVLRETTRRAGVAPNAAYRHFSSHQALFDAVRAAAVGALAQAIEAELRQAEALPDAATRARGMLAAVGRGYLGFAQAETGWFRTAFAFGAHDVEVPTDPARTAAKGLNPFELLGYALDAMVQAGVLPAERRPGAEFLAWSSVHGMALLIIDGPLRRAPPAVRLVLGGRLLRMVEAGL
ncbi:TetR/AcrR family transcriptional regulator [Ottowia sp.]|jgi:AcrR family transcriptional regulator|uniref:TetR/AcrR family transcriptional regulator n=1 Tax=Ottowia sp. TaxID=1898956 RepID=UPI0025CDB7B5|nr:TetR/AcrR family transcriptional regulator [Ottowia sp.]MBK6613867.1 TetR/AcrR family transcriptional regulator [Ottowia sp.]MBK6745569.1 TetR/AcrR family transcriptional regulator [Ottowia sp.]